MQTNEIKVGDKVRVGVSQSVDKSVSGVDMMSLHGGAPWVRQEVTSHLRHVSA